MNPQHDILLQQIEDEFYEADMKGEIVYVKDLTDDEIEVLKERVQHDSGVVELFEDNEVIAFQILPEVIEE